MPKLNDTQLVILSAAAQRDDRLALPLPDSLGLDEAAEIRTLKSLIKRKLVASRAAKRGEPEWQTEPDGPWQTLIITDAGLAAIGVTDSREPDKRATAPQQIDRSSGTKKPARKAKTAPVHRKPANASNKTDSSARRPSKVDQILALLERPNGASIDELTGATGWQPHSVRAALTGLRKRGIEVHREKVNGVTRYQATSK